MSSTLQVYSIESLRTTDSQQKDFDFFRFEYFAKDIEHLKAPHRHHFYTFLLVTGGSGSHSIDFQNYKLSPGRLFLIAPGQVHAWIELINVKGYVVLFNDSFMALSKGRKIMSEWPLFRATQPNYIDLSFEETSRWNDEFGFMEEEILNVDEFTNDSFFYSVSALLIRASRLFKSKQTRIHLGQDFLFNFQELIEDNFLTLKAPKDYAEKMNVTPNYLNALCKKKSGKSAGELIRQRIVLEAKRLLAHTKFSVSEIAFKLNFQDNSYFGRFFKKYTGLTPESFRTKQVS
ncbi:MAG: AraC family transcriptional regulator [Cyclobacteriaceae bacterium]|nr:AraC family transcriptional regulator [Cyclobacteriaceae bacterium]